MKRQAPILMFAAACLLASANCHASDAQEKTVTALFHDRVVEIEDCLVDGEQLWVPFDDVVKVNGFEPKPEGLCAGDICIPIPAADGWTRKQGDRQYLDVTRVAAKVDQPVAVDSSGDVWSFGSVPAVTGRLQAQRQAPDFALPDRQGKTVRLMDFRGKKVLVLTWASWCGCSLDLPGWQAIYDDLKGQNFEIVAAAQDTGGEAASGKFYDAAKATYTTLIDEQHTVSTLYQMINVPTGVWIDEQGQIVRPPEVAYSKEQKVLGTTIGDNRYIAGLRDWVKNGADSKFVVPADKLKEKVRVQDADHRLADAHFKLGVYFHQAGNKDAAETHWRKAQTLNPDSWNYHRQDWSFDPKTAMGKWFRKYRALEGKPYYEPLDLPQ